MRHETRDTRHRRSHSHPRHATAKNKMETFDCRLQANAPRLCVLL